MRKLPYEAANSILTRSLRTFALKTWAIKITKHQGNMPPLLFALKLLVPSLKEGQTVKHARFSEEQIIGILKWAEAGATSTDLARWHGVAGATIYNSRTKYGGLVTIFQASNLLCLIF